MNGGNGETLHLLLVNNFKYNQVLIDITYVT